MNKKKPSLAEGASLIDVFEHYIYMEDGSDRLLFICII